jgi:hypothetical protein
MKNTHKENCSQGKMLTQKNTHIEKFSHSQQYYQVIHS